MNSSSNNIDYGRVIKSGLSKRSVSSTRAVNLKYENSTYNNPFSVSNWPLNSSHGNHSAMNNIKATNLLRDRLVPTNFQHISNTNLLISNYLDSQSTKHKYFLHPQKNPSIYGLNIVKSDIQAKPQTPRDNYNSSKPQTPRAQSHKASAHPILNNGFLKPQVVPSTPNKTELLNTSVSSMSTTIHNRPNTNSVVTNKRAKSGKPLQHPITSTVITDRSNSTPSSAANAPITDPALGSKNARDAFFERLRVTEYLNKSNSALDNNNSGRIQSDQSSTNSSSDLSKPTKKVYDMKKMQYIANLTESLLDNDSLSSANGMSQLNNQFNNGYQSSSNMFSKPYSAKSNFSNVTKIDKQFKKQPEINNVDHAYFYSNMNANKTVNSNYNNNNNSSPVQNDDLEPSSSSASSDKTTVDEADDLFQKAYSQTLNEKLDKVSCPPKLQ